MISSRTALYAGTGAAVASLAAVAFLSRLEGHSGLRPINATSHVIYGTDAPAEGFDARRTLPGFVINIASAYFWGAVFACLSPSRSPHSPRAIIGKAVMTSIVAGVVDYGLVPRRLRPGWELALKPRSVTLALAAMASGLAAGGLFAGSSGKTSRAGDGG